MSQPPPPESLPPLDPTAPPHVPTSPPYQPPVQYPPPGPYQPPVQYPPPGPYQAAPPAPGAATPPYQPGVVPAPAPGYEPPTNVYTTPTDFGWTDVRARNDSLNGFAVASLILAICGGQLLGLIFGIVALVQIKRRGGRGRGMAIAGVVISSLWIAVVITVVVVALVKGGTERDPTSGQVTGSGSVSLENLRVGDCVESITEDELRFALPVVPCTEPHRAEVTAVEAMPNTAYPGDEAVDEQAGTMCTDALATYAPSSAGDESLEVFYFPPNASTWADGDRDVICLLNDPDTLLTRSLAG